MTDKLDWKKSRRSQASSDCVEVHRNLALVRDSKNADGPTLHGAVGTLVGAIRAGALRSAHPAPHGDNSGPDS